MSTFKNDLPGGEPIEPLDPDLAEQAVPGHGVPSQDPSAGAQVGLRPDEAERESKSALVGGGVVAGLVAGAAAGAVMGGPIGVLVGGTVGTIAGALGGEAAGILSGQEPSEPSASGDRPPTDAASLPGDAPQQ